MRVTDLHVYPVKSVAPIDLSEAQVEPWGLAGDRRFVTVDLDGAQVTAREHPALLHVSARAEDGLLHLSAPGQAALTVKPGGPLREVSVWRTPFAAQDVGDEAADWFSARVGKPVRLCWLDDPTRRPLTGGHGRPGDLVSAADAYPLLLTARASLDALNDWIAETCAERGEDFDRLPMRRFRPNVVIDGVDAFAEDAWTGVQIGGVRFRSGGLSSRCVLTTTDPVTLKRGKEPLRTLARRRRWEGKTWFGLNLIPENTADGPARIRVGDPVQVLTE